MTLVTTSCENRNHPAGPSSGATGDLSPKSSPTPSAATNVADQWLGKWVGPEGTYAVLSKKGDKYGVQIHSLDGSATYEGTSVGNRIQFRRNGVTESIHAGNGEETGMKWLLDKKDCLIIKTGEGFCRD